MEPEIYKTSKLKNQPARLLYLAMCVGIFVLFLIPMLIMLLANFRAKPIAFIPPRPILPAPRLADLRLKI